MLDMLDMLGFFPPGSISTILLRNVKSAMVFVAPDPFHVSGNVTEDARVDLIVYEGVEIAGKLLTAADVQAGVGPCTCPM
jgi:hypothetical protein